MCGIAGILRLDGGRPAGLEMIAPMVAAIAHRGPDDSGFFTDGPIAFGMRRLSIIDLDGGHQPIANEDGRLTAIFNGEIYNYQQLRAELEAEGHRFSTRSDTETIVHAYEGSGIDAFTRLRGMFGVAIWDATRQRLVLARDRVGIKPLYYRQHEGWLLFASEIKSLLAAPLVTPSVNARAVHQHVTTRFTGGNETLFDGVRKLLPGRALIAEAGVVTEAQYWDLPRPTEPGPGGMTQAEYAEATLAHLDDSVKAHMVSDVPVGAFLSGGLDSTTIVALMARLSGRVNTYSVGFEGAPGIDELDYARAAAQRLGTNHHELVCAPPGPDALDRIVWHLEEPIADPAVIPTFFVSQLAARDVKVVLTGEGSDETNGGYEKYRVALDSRAWPQRGLTALPTPIRRRVLLGLGHRSGSTARRIERRVGRSLAAHGDFAFGDTELRWKGDAFGLFSADLLEAAAGDPGAGTTVLDEADVEQEYFLSDIRGWMLHDLLLKVDKMSMAHSLEARVPYLDHRYVEFALSVPAALKLRDGGTKMVLRDAAARLIPEEIRRRRQHGFTVPLTSWLAGRLSSLVRETVGSASLARRGYFEPAPLTAIADRAVAGDPGVTTLTFALMLLELWHRRFIDCRMAA